MLIYDVYPRTTLQQSGSHVYGILLRGQVQWCVSCSILRIYIGTLGYQTPSCLYVVVKGCLMKQGPSVSISLLAETHLGSSYL